MTVQKFDELVKKDKELRDKLSADIAALLAREAELDAEMSAAADAGDDVLYRAKKKEKEDVSDSIFVKRSFKDKLSPSVDKDSAAAAWKDYTKDYNKRMQKAIDDFADAKEKLCALYSEMIDYQKDACSTRERLASATGTPVESFVMLTIPYQRGLNVLGALKIANVNLIDPDACYYLSVYSKKNGVNNLAAADAQFRPDHEYARVKSVVDGLKSKDPYLFFS